jgi:CRP-like cAMP-binding protein
MSSLVPSLSQDLTELRFTTGWTDGMVTELTAFSRYVEFSPGQIVFHQGAENDNLYLLCTGRVGLDMYVAGRGGKRILTLSGGELLAWSALLSADFRMTATATALQHVRAIAINAPQLRALCERDHEVGFRVMQWLAQAMAHRLTATRLQLLDLYAHSAADVVLFSHEGR